MNTYCLTRTSVVLFGETAITNYYLMSLNFKKGQQEYSLTKILKHHQVNYFKELNWMSFDPSIIYKKSNAKLIIPKPKTEFFRKSFA
jgi:hypothetical protein